MNEFVKDVRAPVTSAISLCTAAAALLASAMDAVVMANTTMANAVCSRKQNFNGCSTEGLQHGV